MFGVVGLVTLIHVVSRQLWENVFYDKAIELGTTASQVALLDSAVDFFILFALIAGAFGIIFGARGNDAGYQV